MKTMTITGIAILLCIAAPAAAQRGGGGGTGPVAMPRAEIQRIDPGRTISPARDIEIRRGDATGGVTGTRIRHRIDPHRPPNHHARRRWNAANPPPHDHARRRWNAANPSDPSRRREDR